MGRRKTEVVEQPQAEAPPANENGYSEDRAQPVHRVRLRNVSGAVWQNARQDGTVYYTFTLSRSYRDEQSNWHSATSFGAADGLWLAEVARQCTLWICATTQGEEIPF